MQDLLLSFGNLIGINTVEEWSHFRICLLCSVAFMVYWGFILNGQEDAPLAKWLPIKKNQRLFLIGFGVVVGLLLP